MGKEILELTSADANFAVVIGRVCKLIRSDDGKLSAIDPEGVAHQIYEPHCKAAETEVMPMAALPRFEESAIDSSDAFVNQDDEPNDDHVSVRSYDDLDEEDDTVTDRDDADFDEDNEIETE